jgi:hypothetical protein
MRLARHDEIVEAMARAVYETSFQGSSTQIATAALDAMLEAVVELEVGEETLSLIGREKGKPHYAKTLTLKLEPKP